MLSTIIISGALLTVVAAILIKLRRDKQAGKNSCGCGCSGCPSAGLCHGAPPHTHE